MGALQGRGQCSSLFVFARGPLAHASSCRCLFLRQSFSSFRHIQLHLIIVFHVTPPSFLIDGVMLGHRCSRVEEHGLFVSAVGAIKRRRFPASLCLLFLPHLHATSTRTTDSARIHCISPRLPHSLHPTSVDQ